MNFFFREVPYKMLLHMAKLDKPASLSAISFDLRVSSMQVGNVASKLCDGGLISIEPVGNSKCVELTDRGREAAERMRGFLEVVSA